MSLKYAILGYLSTGPGSGYDLRQQLDGGLGWFWSASHSQIYPELKRLEESGLVEAASTTVGEKLEKTVYSIKPEGREALAAWAEQPPVYRPNRDPERLQLIFADVADVADLGVIRRHLEAHRDHFARRRDQLAETRDTMIARKNPRIEERLKGKDQGQQELTMLLRSLAYGGDIRRAELEVAWADEALSSLAALESRS